jgi:very-short-patch-repair endonuclease
MSKLSDAIKGFIEKLLPNYDYETEHYESFYGTRLMFDFCIPDLKVMIEVQGEQHFKFNAFFYKDADAFNAAMHRDALKREWCSKFGYSLVYFTYKEIDKLTDEAFIDRIVG